MDSISILPLEKLRVRALTISFCNPTMISGPGSVFSEWWPQPQELSGIPPQFSAPAPDVLLACGEAEVRTKFRVRF